MQLSQSKKKLAYLRGVRIIEEILKDKTPDTTSKSLIGHAQEQLDAIANIYQNEDEIGKDRYRLYEIQAFIHYLDNKPDDAFDFIEQAIDAHGSTYERAEQIKKLLSNVPQMDEASHNSDLNKKKKI